LNDLFLKACRREPVDSIPVWIMRQAGRYLPEYRAIRERVTFEALLKTPELAARVTLQPIARFRLDAAILFSDILVPVEPMGIKLSFNPGPVLDPPVRTASDVERLKIKDPTTSLPYVYETIKTLRRQLEGQVPLIGFGPAPFTLAAYLVEGKGSKDFEHTKALLYGDPGTARKLLEKTSAAIEMYLQAQVDAGAQAIQIFDSWAGALSADAYRTFALPYAAQIIEYVRAEGVPVIYFALDASHLLDDIRQCGAEVVSLDWRTGLAQASARLEHRFVLQGNLDPSVLFAGPAAISDEVEKVLNEGATAPGHIFNLGHGILPSTPLESVQTLVDAVRRYVPQKARP